MNKLAILAALILLLDGCSPRHSDGWRSIDSDHSLRPLRPAPRARPTVDPKSNEAAEDLVRGFAVLLASGRFADAYMLLGPGAPSRESFESQFTNLHDLRVFVHSAGGQQGAAGSAYVAVPFTLSATRNGKEVHRSAKAVLRRVNDVPGSTEAQRRWHIEQVDWES